MAGEEIPLRVKTNQMNDLLKSLTVLNLTGGQVSSIVYDNDKTIPQKLDEFNFQLRKNQGLPQILRQLQGRKTQYSGRKSHCTMVFSDHYGPKWSNAHV